MQSLLVVLALTGASPAPPAYLSCELAQETGRLHVDVAVDEANQQVTVSLPTTGWTVTRAALFTPEEVRVPDGQQNWLISRVDLSFRRTFEFRPKDDPGEVGRCELKPVPTKRAF